jgi:PHS family inorganic phosphate transporter-like MFS transporter
LQTCPALPWTSAPLTDSLRALSSVLGQFLFGYLADRYGRTRLYGIELVLVIVSTIGVATTSSGYGDLSFLALFTWVRAASDGLGFLSLTVS